MKKNKIIIVLILFLVTILFVANVYSKSEKTIEVVRVLNLGHIPISDTIIFDLPIKNISKHSLTIDYVNTPCGCLRSFFKTLSFNSNEITNVHFIYKPMNLGYIEQNIFIYFKELNTPVHVLIKCHAVK